MAEKNTNSSRTLVAKNTGGEVMKRILVILPMMLVLGCVSFPWQKPDPKPDPDPVVTLPQNPKVPDNLPNSNSEMVSFKRKDYDKTYRPAWPTEFYRLYKMGDGSYTMVGEHKAKFRGYDGDHGAKRPKYTMSQSVTINYPVTCILYSKDGTAVGWFKAPHSSYMGELPDQAEGDNNTSTSEDVQGNVTGNVPDTNGEIPDTWSKNTKRNWNAGKAVQGQYYGKVTFGNKEQATNFRYALRPHFEWDLNVLTAFPKPDKPETGHVNIVVNGNVVTWAVNP